ncbi:hypothetical protein [Actinokineospora sp. HUAS TT18]|uniref:hypothetical protein n=1 Tax=Actinokineospora sp. HUAS TT18 TaxID=3447451 RepID=UPI003F522E65
MANAIPFRVVRTDDFDVEPSFGHQVLRSADEWTRLWAAAPWQGFQPADRPAPLEIDWQRESVVVVVLLLPDDAHEARILSVQARGPAAEVHCAVERVHGAWLGVMTWQWQVIAIPRVEFDDMTLTVVKRS